MSLEKLRSGSGDSSSSSSSSPPSVSRSNFRGGLGDIRDGMIEQNEPDQDDGDDDLESDRAKLTRTGGEQLDNQTSTGDGETVIDDVDIAGSEGEHGADGIASREQSRTSRTVTIIGGEDEHGADGIASREHSADVVSDHTVVIGRDDQEEDGGVIETGIYGADRDPGTQTMVDEDGQSDGIDGSEISGDPADTDAGDWGFGPGRAGTEPDYDGDGEPGGNLTDNPVLNPDIDVPGVPDAGDLLPWWAPIAAIGTVGTLVAVVVLWLVRPFVAAFATAR